MFPCQLINLKHQAAEIRTVEIGCSRHEKIGSIIPDASTNSGVIEVLTCRTFAEISSKITKEACALEYISTFNTLSSS